VGVIIEVSKIPGEIFYLPGLRGRERGGIKEAKNLARKRGEWGSTGECF
jgi:hypothetical protein